MVDSPGFVKRTMARWSQSKSINRVYPQMAFSVAVAVGASPKRRRFLPLRTCLNQAIDASPWPVAVLHLLSATEMALRVDVIGCGHLTAIRLELWLCTIWPTQKNGVNQLRSEPELNMVGPKLKTPNISIYYITHQNWFHTVLTHINPY